MGIFDSLFKKAISSQVAEQMRNVNALMGQQHERLEQNIIKQIQLHGQGAAIYKNGNPQAYIDEGYCSNADLYAVIKLVSETFAGIPKYVYTIKDEKAYRQLKTLTPGAYSDDYMETYYKLHRKSLEMVGPDDELQKLLDNPNPNTDAFEFWKEVAGWLLLDGNSYLNYPIIDGFNGGKPFSFWTLPPKYTTIISVQNFYRHILAYRVDIDGLKLVDTDQVLHLKYWNPNFSYDGQDLLGLSPIRALWAEVQLSNAGAASAIAQFQNGGPAVIVYNKNITADKMGIDNTALLQKKMDQRFTGNENRGKMMLSPGELGLIQTGLSPVDLNLDGNRLLSMGKVCNGYGVSDTLFNNHQASTESNVKEMRKGLYTNAALPLMYKIRDGLNRKVAPLFNTGRSARKVIMEDITGISELQPDMQTMATWLNTAWWVTPNEKREMMKFDRRTEPEFDEPWPASGIMPLSDAMVKPDQDINFEEDETEQP